MLRTSSRRTSSGGFRSNVIPGDSEATLDVRALPDEDMEAFLSTLRAVIDDPAVEIIPQWAKTPGPSRATSARTEMFLTLERVPEADVSQAITLPTMLTGATDSAQLRAPKGVQAYGLGSAGHEEDANRIHGNDERLSSAACGSSSNTSTRWC